MSSDSRGLVVVIGCSFWMRDRRHTILMILHQFLGFLVPVSCARGRSFWFALLSRALEVDKSVVREFWLIIRSQQKLVSTSQQTTL